MNYDIKINTNDITDLGKKYQDVIEQVSQLYNEIIEFIDELDAAGKLSGNWYNAFKETFSEIEEKYRLGLAGLILSNASLGTLYIGIEQLIGYRDEIANQMN